MAARSDVAHRALALGVVGSLAFNIGWAWPRPVLVGVGVLMSLVLPTAITLWRSSGHVTGWARFERTAVMVFITAGAALYTEVHASLLLHDAGLPWLIAWLPALVGEALVAQAARVGTPVTRPAQRRDAPSKSPAVTPRTPSPGVAAGPAPLARASADPAVDENPEQRRKRLAAERSARYRASKREAA